MQHWWWRWWRSVKEKGARSMRLDCTESSAFGQRRATRRNLPLAMESERRSAAANSGGNSKPLGKWQGHGLNPSLPVLSHSPRVESLRDGCRVKKTKKNEARPLPIPSFVKTKIISLPLANFTYHSTIKSLPAANSPKSEKSLRGTYVAYFASTNFIYHSFQPYNVYLIKQRKKASGLFGEFRAQIVRGGDLAPWRQRAHRPVCMLASVSWASVERVTISNEEFDWLFLHFRLLNEDGSRWTVDRLLG
ncbi:hypothetical protein LXL04_013775 [Taraxacum kok-saghyz]